MLEDLQKLKDKVLAEIKKSQDLEFLENVWRKYLGRKGELREFADKLKELSREEKVKIGQMFNEIKNELEREIEKKKLEIRNWKLEIDEFLDPTLPGKKPAYGHLHPHTQMKYQVAEIFHSMGFEILEGPEAETEYYNFEALNIPAGHPARDMWDTFYIKNQESKIQNQKLLLRTHTSAMQARVMEEKQPPLKVCVIGKCYRHEATDASHEHTLYQIEGFVVGPSTSLGVNPEQSRRVDEQISVANLIYTLKSFLGALFGREVKVRLRPSYFPFTEPSFEMDFICLNCGGKGCAACSQTGWVEILGCGMINPKVFEFAGYPKNKYTGFAFGVGLDRLVMMKHQIDDIRWFHGGDLRFLKQF